MSYESVNSYWGQYENLSKEFLISRNFFHIPLDFNKILIDNRSYTSEELLSAILEQTTDLTNVDFVSNYMHSLSKDFYEKYETAIYKRKFLISFIYNNTIIKPNEYVESKSTTSDFKSFFDIRDFGYIDAKYKKKHSIHALLDDNSYINQHDKFIPSSNRKYAYDYENLSRNLYNLHLYMKGYAQFLFLCFIKSEFSLSGAEKMDEANVAKYKGLSPELAKEMPENLFNDFDNKKLESYAIIDHILKYYENLHIDNYASSLIEKWNWESDFLLRKSRTKDLKAFVKAELESHDYSTESQKKVKKKREYVYCYQLAIEGHNPTVKDLTFFYLGTYHTNAAGYPLSKIESEEVPIISIEDYSAISIECQRNDQQEKNEKILTDMLKYIKDVVIGYCYATFRERISKLAKDSNARKVPQTTDILQDEIKTTLRELTHKELMILCQSLGIFDIPEFKSLTLDKKGRLLNLIFNLDSKNCEMFLTNIDSPKNAVSMDKNFVKTRKNILKVKSILIELGLSTKKADEDLEILAK